MSLMSVAAQWGDLVASLASPMGLDPNALLAIIQQESGGNANATNNTGGDAVRGGSYGLMQVSYQTARGYGYAGQPAGLLDPTTNVTYGARYFMDCVAQAAGDLAGAFSCYNSGSTTGAPNYATSVLANYQALTANAASSANGSVDASAAGCANVVVVGVISGLAYLTPILIRLFL
jgi:soluble lytic murein transglycosylase-like protein